MNPACWKWPSVVRASSIPHDFIYKKLTASQSE